ncbi:MAG TPA: response regulator transcription factor [Bryobacteraceae bacterium]|nr:response regulator transcription factor [Bryobacteraceae bacterium]
MIGDDCGLLREGLAAIFRASGYEVVAECADGKESMEAIQNLAPDVAILDAQLSGFFTLEIIRGIRQAELKTRVIVLSPRKERRAVVEAMRAGANGFVMKSGSSRVLLEAMTQILAGGVFISPEIAPDEIFASQRKASYSDPVDALSAREYQVFSLLVDGIRAKEIASRLHLSPKTVDTYRASMMRKLDIHDLAGLVRFSIRREANGDSIDHSRPSSDGMSRFAAAQGSDTPTVV